MGTSLVHRVIPIQVSLPAWRLLGMYLAILDDDLKKVGHKNTNYVHTISGILEAVLVDHQEEIRERFHELRLSTEKRRVAGSFDADQLDAIEHASASEIPEVFRVDPISRDKPISRRERAIHRATGGPGGSIPRPPRKPR